MFSAEQYSHGPTISEFPPAPLCCGGTNTTVVAAYKSRRSLIWRHQPKTALRLIFSSFFLLSINFMSTLYYRCFCFVNSYFSFFSHFFYLVNLHKSTIYGDMIKKNKNIFGVISGDFQKR